MEAVWFSYLRITFSDDTKLIYIISFVENPCSCIHISSSLSSAIFFAFWLSLWCGRWVSCLISFHSHISQPSQPAAQQCAAVTWIWTEMGDLPSLRQKIDSLDTTLVNLLNERARVSLDIGAAKKQLEGDEPIGRWVSALAKLGYWRLIILAANGLL
jgi:hypothetical protein